MSYRGGPGPLEDVEAIESLPKRGGKEVFSDYIKRAALELGHRKAMPGEIANRYTPKTVLLARRVLSATSFKERLDAIFRGDFDNLKPGEREPGADG